MDKMVKLERELEKVEKYLREESISAFATGSRIQGTGNKMSDLDIVVIDDVNVEVVGKELSEEIDAGWPVDVVHYSLEDILHRIDQYDPYIVTMVQSMEPLTLDEKIEADLRKAVTTADPDSEFIENIAEVNIYRAAESTAQAIIYEAYIKTAEKGYRHVPPQELPDLVSELEIMPGSSLDRVLELKRQVEHPEGDTREAFNELVSIYKETQII